MIYTILLSIDVFDLIYNLHCNSKNIYLRTFFVCLITFAISLIR